MTNFIATGSAGQQPMHDSYWGSSFLGSKGHLYRLEDGTCEAGSCMPSHFSELWRPLKKFLLLMAR